MLQKSPDVCSTIRIKGKVRLAEETNAPSFQELESPKNPVRFTFRWPEFPITQPVGHPLYKCHEFNPSSSQLESQ
jgi:hypothetical protein